MTRIFTYNTAKQIVVLTVYCLIWACVFWVWGYTVASLCRLIWHGIRKFVKKIGERHKENPFRGYMEFLHKLQELSAREEDVYSGVGREFLSLIETTDMQKVYKMLVLYSFYNHRDIR